MSEKDIKKIEAYEYTCPYCGENSNYFNKTIEGCEKDLISHLEFCHKNPDNNRCASCKHFMFAETFHPKDADFEYGVCDRVININKTARLCHYVDCLISSGSVCCKSYLAIGK